MLAFVLNFLKSVLVPLRSTPPTAEDIQAFEAYEDESGNYGQYPSPSERYQDAVEWVAEMRELPLWALLRWRLAVAWMPVWLCRSEHREQRLVGEWVSRRLFPDLFAIRRRQAMKRRASLRA